MQREGPATGERPQRRRGKKKSETFVKISEQRSLLMKQASDDKGDDLRSTFPFYTERKRNIKEFSWGQEMFS